MKILAFNTTNSQLGVALIENEKLLAEVEIGQNSNQAELLIVEIENILRSQNIWYQNIDAVSTIKGPGSFTGVRIGLTAAKIIKLATNLPLFTFDSLAVLAHDHSHFQGKIIAIIDAKMDEFFVAEFISQAGEIKVLQESHLIKLEDLSQLKIDDESLIIGSGKDFLREIFAKKNLIISTKDDEISAKNIAFMALDALQTGASQDESHPLYLRQPKITQRK